MINEKMREDIEAFAHELWKHGWNEKDRESLIEEYRLTPAEVDAVFELFKEYDNERMQRIVADYAARQYDYAITLRKDDAIEKINEAVNAFENGNATLIDTLNAIYDSVR